MPGKWRFVTDMALGSISLAHTGVIPKYVPASGTAPIPSKREPRVIVAVLLFIALVHPPVHNEIAVDPR
jgi:hypothetical protein